MRIQVGKIVDVDAGVNLQDLKPLDRIIAAGINAYRNTAMYKRRYAETEERKEEQKRNVREALIDNLLSIIYAQLEENQLLQDKDDLCTGIVIKIPARFTPYLQDALESHEFDAYETTIIPPSRLLSQFADAPYLLYVRHKGG